MTRKEETIYYGSGDGSSSMSCTGPVAGECPTRNWTVGKGGKPNFVNNRCADCPKNDRGCFQDIVLTK